METFRESINSHRRIWLFAVSAGVVLMAFLLRIWNLGAESAWIDEAYSIELAKHTFMEILQGSAADQHPPLYYVILSAWFRLGTGILHARLLSVILGVISVGQIMHLGHKLGGVYVGLIGGLLLALSPVHVWYSQEIRMYMLLLVLTSASTTTLWWALQKKGLWCWILYSLFIMAALYTHYFAIFIILFQGFWMILWIVKGNDKKDLWQWVASILLAAIFFFPWMPTAINQARFHTMTWVESPSLVVLRDTLIRLLFGAAPLALPEFLLWIFLSVLLVGLVWSIRFVYLEFSKGGEEFLYIASWGLIPFFLISIVALLYPIYQFKQYLIVVGAFLLLYTWITYLLPKTIQVTALVIIILSAGASLVYQQAILTKDDWRAAAFHIDENAIPGDAIFGNPAASSFALEQYVEFDEPFFGVPQNYNIISGGWEGDMLTPEVTGDILGQITVNFERVWLVEFFPEFWDESKTVESMLDNSAIMIDERDFGRIRVRLFALE